MRGELDVISERLDVIESRLEKLEKTWRSSGTKARDLHSKATSKPVKKVNNNYLKRTIEEAMRRFEKEHTR